jgi:hypothetical protein
VGMIKPILFEQCFHENGLGQKSAKK